MIDMAYCYCILCQGGSFTGIEQQFKTFLFHFHFHFSSFLYFKKIKSIFILIHLLTNNTTKLSDDSENFINTYVMLVKKRNEICFFIIFHRQSV